MKIDENNTSTTADLKLVEYLEISTSFPNEWILLANPVVNENSDILKGILLFHSKDKREVCYKGREKVEGFEKISVVFTGKHNTQRRIGIMKRVLK